MTTIPRDFVLRCGDCQRVLPVTADHPSSRAGSRETSVDRGETNNGSSSEKKRPNGFVLDDDEADVQAWWCRDCNQPSCASCHLMRGHSEHRANAWRPEEVFRSAVQALEGRCSMRSKRLHDQKIAIKEFLSKVEIVLLNELSRSLEASNEPDRLLISRLNRVLAASDLKAELLRRTAGKPIYNVPSPTRPAWKTWNLGTEQPQRMHDMLETIHELLQLPRRDIREDEDQQQGVILKERSEWNVREAAEILAAALGQNFHGFDTASVFSGHVPNGSTWSFSNQRDEDSRSKRGRSADSSPAHILSNLPLEPSVLVRDRPTSFRERSVTTNDDTLSSPEAVSMSAGGPVESKPPSAMSAISSLPAYQPDSSFDSHYSAQQVTPLVTSPAPPNSAAAAPSSSRATPIDEKHRAFGSDFLTRPICVTTFRAENGSQQLAVSDSCGGVYITDLKGKILEHVPIKNASASSIAVDEKNRVMYVSVMQAKSRSVYVFDIADRFKKLDVIACPKEPKIELTRTRWLTVGPRGQLYMCSGDNNKSALWTYIRQRKGWKVLKESRKTRYQYLCVAEDQVEYKAVVLLTCDAATNRLLLFVIDHSLSLINEYDLSKTYRLGEHMRNPASALVDEYGNLLVLDYANGKLWILLSGVKGIRRLKEIVFERPLGQQEALGISAQGDWVHVACFGAREIRSTRYLVDGVFQTSQSNGLRTPPSQRSKSLPRSPNESTV